MGKIRARRILLTLAWLAASIPAVRAQYELDEMTVHAGAGLGALLHTGGTGLGPAANANFDFTHYPCGKAFAIQGVAGVTLGQTNWADGQATFGPAGLGKTRLNWAVGELGAAVKLRVHDYHRPREMALVVGPRLWLPVATGVNTPLVNGDVARTDAKVPLLLVGGNLGLQFRQPAPDKKSWFIEPGIFWSPMPFLEAADDSRALPVYLYLNFGFAFWDERG